MTDRPNNDAVIAGVVAKMLLDANEFNTEVIDLPIPDRPTALEGDRKEWAIIALREELDELDEADGVADQADALIDMTYFALGRLVEMGVPARAVWDEVQRANMTKIRGTQSKRPGSLGFDAVKPEGWEAPTHAFLTGLSLRELRDQRHLATLYRASTFRAWQEIQPKPRIAVIGHARHGKDTVAELLRDRYGFRFQSSSLWAAKNIMLDAFYAVGKEYASAEECFEDRGAHRAFWYDTISRYNEHNPTRLGRELLEDVDIYVGIRSEQELTALQKAGLIDLTVWVDAGARLPPEPTSSCTVQPTQADLVLRNNLGPGELAAEVEKLMCGVLPRIAPHLFLPEDAK